MSLSTPELESRLVYAAIVAGKSANFADKATGCLWERARPHDSPFRAIRRWSYSGAILEVLKACRTGNYRKLSRCLPEMATSGLDLTTVTPEQLEVIHGIGPKTARFFVLWTRPWERYACLDTHILKWLGCQGYQVSKSTPPQPAYSRLEAIFLEIADTIGMSPRDLDYRIWCKAAGRSQETAGFPARKDRYGPIK